MDDENTTPSRGGGFLGRLMHGTRGRLLLIGGGMVAIFLLIKHFAPSVPAAATPATAAAPLGDGSVTIYEPSIGGGTLATSSSGGGSGGIATLGGPTPGGTMGIRAGMGWGAPLAPPLPSPGAAHWPAFQVPPVHGGVADGNPAGNAAMRLTAFGHPLA